MFFLYWNFLIGVFDYFLRIKGLSSFVILLFLFFSEDEAEDDDKIQENDDPYEIKSHSPQAGTL